MKKVLALILVMLLTLSLVACNSSNADPTGTDPVDTKPTDDGDTFKVAISCAEYNEWNQLYYKVIEEKAKEYGWECEVFDAKQDANQQINDVNSIVAQGFNALTIQPADNAALAPAMEAAADAGLIVVSHYDIDESLGINDKIYQVLFGQKASGVMQAEEFIKRAGEKGKVGIIAGLTGADNAQQRTAGFMEVLDKYPDMIVVDTKYCDWDTQKAEAAAADMITANPDMTAFLTQDDGMAKGVYAAIENAGKKDQIKIYSQGFYDYSIDALKEGKWEFTITYPAGFFARDAMEMIHEIVEGGTPERIKVLGMELVTVENCDTAPHD